ncbi:MAG: hypothetical protein MHM6MM_008207 [Cercozoa sp. M6MM]
MSSSTYERELEVALDLAKQAGAVIAEAFDQAKHVDTKSTSVDLVTSTDKECERVILGGLREAFPSHSFIGEESHEGGGFSIGSEPTWVVDPVDGTNNFVHAFPFVCVCIGLLVDKQPVLGVVYNPVIDELYVAVKGQGATCNGKRIRVSQCASIRQAIVSTEFGYDRTAQGVAEMTGHVSRLLTAQIRGVRSLGSCAMNVCSVARGRLDAFFEGKNESFGPKPWDMVAAAIILTEAGGVMRDWQGGELDITSGRIMAANSPQLADEIIACLGGNS